MSHDRTPPTGKALAGLSLAALGVVYGDIGTSPLYALKECFGGPHAVALTHDNVLGVLSLIFWSLNFVVSFKYIGLVMRADNRGEGGILALVALVRPGGHAKGRGFILIVGLFGAALLYGDGVITPAISVLGAVEGLKVATPIFEHWVIPITVAIITALFAVQSRGTAGVGRIFGPVTTIYFICIAILGVRGIALNPEVLHSLNPAYAVEFFLREQGHAFVVLAAVVLVITGGEALYADMGHIGPRPIRLAWFAVVLPALALNYFGQGALLLKDSSAVSNPFYLLAPDWALYPLVVIATGAAVVASQALISGAYSLTQQAMQLGFAPRMRLIHTSRTEIGQIYMPGVNWTLWVACLGLVFAFQSSTNLAATYGVAVTGTMLTTSLLFAIVMRKLWHWSLWRVVPITALFILVDAAFLGANLLKIPDGGYVPLLAALVVFLLMSTWKQGRAQVTAMLRESSLELDLFVPDLAKRRVHRVPGIAVFMTSLPDVAPPVLLHHLKHNKVLHETVVLMTVTTLEIPLADPENRVTVESRGEGFYSVIARYGFMETPDIPSILEVIAGQIRPAEDGKVASLRMQEVSFFLGRETLIVAERTHGGPRAADGMSAWRARLFGVMSRNAQSATAFFGLPPNRVIELGAQIQV
ncbi:MAG: potassium transporter Kup [Gemmatimonadota bacterium]